MESITNEDKRIAERISRIREAFAAARNVSAPMQQYDADQSFNDFESFVKWEPFSDFESFVKWE